MCGRNQPLGAPGRGGGGG
ncbi:Protein of unknown function, partial [Gryllus bimaculatus]